MFDTFETIRKALGIESTLAFVLTMAIVGFLIFGFVAWVVDRNSKHVTTSPVESVAYSQKSSGSPAIGDQKSGISSPQAKRQSTTRTPKELLDLYKNISPLQGDDLMQPFKALWMTVKGRVQTNPVDAGYGTSQFHMSASDGAECVCTFTKEWREAVKRIRAGDDVIAQCQISEGQNGHVLYLENCDLLQ